MRAFGAACGVVGTAGIGLWWWWRRHPTSRPFAQRWWVDFPHPFITQERLHLALDPRPGQRVLAIGVGSGRYAVPVADVLGGSGLVAAVDLHVDMLHLVRRRSSRAGQRTVVPLAADALALPFANASFDAAWMVSCLGQVPDAAAALAEAGRVVRPGGPVVVGELAYDPHGVFFGELRSRAAAAHLRMERRFGGWLGYFARLTVPHSARV
jgi:ubiquinone/menaquinone biosynthesis C-methylase UbiE